MRPFLLAVLGVLLLPSTLGAEEAADAAGDEAVTLNPLYASVPAPVGATLACRAPAVDLLDASILADGVLLRATVRVASQEAPMTCQDGRVQEDATRRRWRAWMSAHPEAGGPRGRVEVSWDQYGQGIIVPAASFAWASPQGACTARPPVEATRSGDAFTLAFPLQGVARCGGVDVAYDLRGMAFATEGRGEAWGAVPHLPPDKVWSGYAARDDAVPGTLRT